mmetsp:Transcript_16118/g.22623  ORF Transcript_16118/g.22623 Transcript_16118/m.22623 type:complete len:101 (+) Transcript_16118:369-671(+)
MDELIRRDNGKESVHPCLLRSWLFIDFVEDVSECSVTIAMTRDPFAGFNPAKILAASPFHVRPLSWLPSFLSASNLFLREDIWDVKLDSALDFLVDGRVL